jgi:fatty acid desaturase
MDLINRIIASLKTYIRGIALPGEKPLFIVTPMMVVAASACTLVFDLAATQLIWSSQRAWLFPLFVPLFALGQASLWYLYMVRHQAIHGAVSTRKWVNEMVAELASIICVAQPTNIYLKKHLREHHHPKRLATSADPDFRWLKTLGFFEGRSIDEYWTLLWLTLLDPRYYVRNLMSRVRGHLIQAGLVHRASMLISWGVIIGSALTFHAWAPLLMYVMLVTVAFPISALLQTLTEHQWGSTEHPLLKTRARLLPIDSNPHLILLYLYWKMAVLSTDLGQHPTHHHARATHEWPMVAFSESARADLPNAIWGIRAQFRASFESLAKAEPAK